MTTLILIFLTVTSQSKEAGPLDDALLRSAGLWPEIPFDGKVSDVYWSPDGEWGAYTVDENTPAFNKDRAIFEASSICVVNKDRYTVKRIFTGFASDVTEHNEDIYPWLDRYTKLVWSPDSNRVLFRKEFYFYGTHHAHGTPLFDIEVRTGLVRKLSKDLMINGRPDDKVGYSDPIVFSPDGSKLLIVQGGGKLNTENRRIVLLDYKTLKRKTMTPDGCASIMPKWSPDGKRIAYTSFAYDIPDEERSPIHDGIEIGALSRFVYGRVWVMNADGSGRVRLANDSMFTDSDVNWIDENIIQFKRTLIDASKAGLRWEASIWQVNRDGTGLKFVSTIKPVMSPKRSAS